MFRMFRCFRIVLFFFVPCLALAICAGMFALRPVLGSIEPAQIDRQTLGKVLLLRDFRRHSPEFTEQILHRVEAEFGKEKGKKPVFEFSLIEKKIIAYFQSHRSENPSFCENNITLLAKTKYWDLARQYRTAKSKQKQALLKEVLAEIDYWQNVYFDFLDAAGLPRPSVAELSAETLRTFTMFKVGVSDEDATTADAFALAIGEAVIAAEIKKTMTGFFPFSAPAAKPKKEQKKEPETNFKEN